jgi:hypothetical protein
VALAHHDAAHGHRGAVEKPNLGAQQRGGWYAAGLQLAIGLTRCTAQVVGTST